uniref:Uncharacterized protein n=2 Tax=unclassified Caudoviricetes TaxID=2788787 RepID=A0A8S5V6I4_9CAUD|nr:MAG TPA: hypothetical protein [Siphoviridae sp. ctMBu2]DAG02293.1 MAG TPA: hypothetical protein [Myoviridae sp. ctRci5]DAK39495.1 MAG TPA: hypothetical protein [Caudoviricetes sp.]DAN26631.1 MAG TPA: hypothetical protein [Caudoviricetes sp.]DAU29620.1 MAG TPA: hypothetical protein [Caudoviricetes sp.]
MSLTILRKRGRPYTAPRLNYQAGIASNNKVTRTTILMSAFIS